MKLRNLFWDWSNTPDFEYSGDALAEEILGIKQGLREMIPLPTSTWQSQEDSKHPEMQPLELANASIAISIPNRVDRLQELVRPNLPWAEDHFKERVGGEPLNPPPSSSWWPYARVDNAEHKHGEQFSHTYPERFWPQWANVSSEDPGRQEGIRYYLGDLNDVVKQLGSNVYTRQAYLPVFFPEDTGAVSGQRVPCSLGYHFYIRPDEEGVDTFYVNYFMRSCDIMRHFVDDMYLAARLGQWVRDGVEKKSCRHINMGQLTMFMSSLHMFIGDIPIVKAQVRQFQRTKGRGFSHGVQPSAVPQ